MWVGKREKYVEGEPVPGLARTAYVRHRAAESCWDADVHRQERSGPGQMPWLQAPLADRKAEPRVKIQERNLVLRKHLSPKQLPWAMQEDASRHRHR